MESSTHRHTTPPVETRERILAAARQVYVQRNGQHGATTREIAQLAGVNEVTLFRHFGSKERLLAEMVERCCPVREVTDELVAETGELRADLIRIGLALARGMEAVEDLIGVHMADVTLDGGSPVFEGPKRAHQRVVEFMKGQVEAARITGDPRRLTRAFTGMVFSHVMGKRIWNDVRPTSESDIALYTDIFLKGTLSHE